MRVAINGVGVAGPALAYWLRRCRGMRFAARRRGHRARDDRGVRAGRGDRAGRR